MGHIHTLVSTREWIAMLLLMLLQFIETIMGHQCRTIHESSIFYRPTILEKYNYVHICLFDTAYVIVKPVSFLTSLSHFRNKTTRHARHLILIMDMPIPTS